MGTLKKEINRQRQAELLGLFKQVEDHYEEKPLHGKVYIKQFNGETQRWQVAVYTDKSFARYSQYKQAIMMNRELDSQLQTLLQKED